ncbi:MAG: hypothetical protein KTR25_15095 [Myxococcales bacterium]|nr:hypothetical protein [Myxococcales bacterium]
MRILYGVHGYSRGHATRAAAVLSELVQKYEVMILAGQDAFDLLKNEFEIERIESLRFYYGEDSRISSIQTIQKNFPLVTDLLLHGSRSRELDAKIRAFAPRVAISDAEPWTHRAAHRLDIPRVSFDHFGIMVHCDVPFARGDRTKSFFDRLIYKFLMGQPERVLVSSFYDAPALRDGTKIIGPLLRKEVRNISAPARGEHMLVYLNNGHHQLTEELKASFRSLDMPIKLYGCRRTGTEATLEFCPPAGRAFLEDLASAKAVISTAGNQLVGEALFFGRPLLVIPEGTVEQRMNAAAVERLGVGEVGTFEALDGARLRSFLRNLPRYETNAKRCSTDGRDEALELLNMWIEELGKRKRSPKASLYPVRA